MFKLQETSRSRHSLTPEESLRITVGNDRYLQRPSAVERLGPPVKYEERRPAQEDKKISPPKSRQFPYDTKEDLLYGRRSPPRSSSRDRPFATLRNLEDDCVPVLDIRPLDTSFSSQDSKPTQEELSTARELFEPDRFGEIAAQQSKELPLLPGLGPMLDIEDEDKFLYGDDAATTSAELSRTREPYNITTAESATKGMGQSNVNQFGDQDYRTESTSVRHTDSASASYSADRFTERMTDDELYGHSPFVGESFQIKTERDSPVVPPIRYLQQEDQQQQQPGFVKDTYESSRSALLTESTEIDRLLYDDRVTSDDLLGGARNTYPNNGDGLKPRNEPQTAEPADDKNVDPTLQNILKSIGFNFKLSELMQQRAQKEREEQLKKQELEYLVNKGGSFMKGGLSNINLSAAFSDAEIHAELRREEREQDEARKTSKRNLIDTAETYEQKAKRYLEEQARAYQEEQKRKLHPLDYLTESVDKKLGTSSSRLPQEQLQDRGDVYSGADTYGSRGTQDQLYARKHGRDYNEKLFEDDDADEKKYNKRPKLERRSSSQERRDRGRSNRSARHEDSHKREEAKVSTAAREREESRDRKAQPHSHTSPVRDSRREIEHEASREPRQVLPGRKLAKGDLRNLLVTDKTSNRLVLPPRIDRERNKQTLRSPKEEPVEPARVKTVLSAKDLEKLEKEKEERRKRLQILETELDKLRRQQGEMMRKRQRLKDGHKDPLLVENSKLQDEITKQITDLRKAVESQPREEGKAPASAVKFKMEKVPTKILKVR